MTPEELLTFLDSSFSFDEPLSAAVTAREAELRSLESNGDSENRDGAFFNYMLASYEYLSHKFRVYWFETVDVQDYVNQQRPHFPAFSPADFEQLVRTILYFISDREFATTKASYDEGVDLHCQHTSDFGRDGVAVATWVVQCKLYRGYVPVSDLRDFFGVITEKVAEGYFVTTGQLTPAGLRFWHSANKSPRANSLHVLDKTGFDALLDTCDDLVQAWRDGMELFSEDGAEDEVKAAHKRIEDVRGHGSKLLHGFREADDQRQLF